MFAGGTYYATPYLALDLQGVRYLQRRENSEGTTATLLVGRANSFLSKRTTVYTSVGYLFNSQLAANAVAAGGTVGTGMNRRGVMAAIQQKF